MASVEWLRVLACVGIIAFHCKIPGRQIALGGLHAFVALTVAFSVRSNQPLKAYALARWRTLGVPWLVWSAVYGAAALASAWHHQRWSGWSWWLLLSGPSIHLWFLPFALVTTLAVRALPASMGARTWSALTLVTLWPMLLRHGLPTPISQWLSVTPAALLGVAIGRVTQAQQRFKHAVVALGTVLLLALLFSGYSEALPLLAGLPICALAWDVPGMASPRLLNWSRLTFGVYLVHPLLMNVLSRWTHRGSLWEATSITGASFVAAEIVRRTPMARFIGVSQAQRRD